MDKNLGTSLPMLREGQWRASSVETRAGGPDWAKFSLIGRLFSFGSCVKNTTAAQIFGLIFSTVKNYINFDIKMGRDTFG
jgi:hypothetical protein